MKKILFIYPSMVVGGSTTSLLAFINNLDPDVYDIDLQLFRNEGPLLDALPENVTLLPAAEIYTGTCGRIIKLFKCFFSGYLFKAVFAGITGKKRSLISRGILCDFQAKLLSRKNEKHYDYAIGFLESWSDRYLAFCTSADKKYGWLHVTFDAVTTEPKEELAWMEHADKIALVTELGRTDFIKALPQMAEKAITIENITDGEIIRKRGELIDETDELYSRFASSPVFKIITVCRLSINHKGLDRLVTCAKELKNSGEKFLWYIVGDGDDRAKVESLIAAADVGDCVILTGNRMNPHPFIAAADIMCMPSKYEGKPMVVTESMILCTPPVVTEYLSANEQIKNGVDGIVVNNDDTSIISAVRRCIAEPDTVAKMREALKNNDYSNTEYIKDIENILFK